MRAADKRSSSSSIWLGFALGGSGFCCSVGFRESVELICSRIGRVGRGLIDDSAIDLRGWGASGLDILAALGPSEGFGSSGSSCALLRLAVDSSRRLLAASLKVSNQELDFSFTLMDGSASVLAGSAGSTGSTGSRGLAGSAGTNVSSATAGSSGAAGAVGAGGIVGCAKDGGPCWAMPSEEDGTCLGSAGVGTLSTGSFTLSAGSTTAGLSAAAPCFGIDVSLGANREVEGVVVVAGVVVEKIDGAALNCPHCQH